ncbi:hypothetical protein [uncultured Brevundimonas sp.]|uniref:hypothetical protein n=1 Tax=uncultured Brevundimonas sp. TaxID=213418 RepID=UPI0030EC2594|tara:strand:- start:1558 stop:2100 length:543 start_codon:yes stop_codon:yes gene_type:complete
MQETLEKDKLTLRESAIQHVTCGRCGVPYDYDHTAEASAAAGYSMTGREIPWEEARQKAGARLTRRFERGKVVPCPDCGTLTPAMQRQQIKAALQDLGVVAIALLVAWGVALAMLESGALAWGIGILALLTALGFTLKLLSLPFGGYHEKIGRPAGTASTDGGDLFDSLRLPPKDARSHL